MSLYESHLQITLVTVGINEPYESSLRAMRHFARDLGFISTLAWMEKDFLNDPVTRQHMGAFTMLDSYKNESIICSTWQQYCRPYCAAFKPVVLMRALRESGGDYVMWADSSKYENYTILLTEMVYANVTVVDAVRTLVRRSRMAALPSMYGVANCSCNNTICQSNGAYMQPKVKLAAGWGPWLDQFELSALQSFNMIDQCALVNDLWIQNPHILLANTKFNLGLLMQWLQLAIQRPRAFCRSHSQDQAAWALIISKNNLPVLAFKSPYKAKTLFDVIVGLSTGSFKWIERSSVLKVPLGNSSSHQSEFSNAHVCET